MDESKEGLVLDYFFFPRKVLSLSDANKAIIEASDGVVKKQLGTASDQWQYPHGEQFSSNSHLAKFNGKLLPSWEWNEVLRDMAESVGADSFVVYDAADNGITLAVLSSSQIKSAAPITYDMSPSKQLEAIVAKFPKLQPNPTFSWKEEDSEYEILVAVTGSVYLTEYNQSNPSGLTIIRIADHPTNRNSPATIDVKVRKDATWEEKVRAAKKRVAQGNVIPLSQRFNPSKDSILYSPPLETDTNLEALRIKAKAKNQPLLQATREQMAVFGSGSLGQSRLANPGTDQTSRDQWDIANAFHEHERMVQKDAQVMEEAIRIVETDPDGLEEKLLQAVFGDQDVQIRPSEIAAARMLINLRMKEAGSDREKMARVNDLSIAYRQLMGDQGRILRQGRDWMMSPEERRAAQIADAIYEATLRIEQQARAFKSPQQQRDFLRKALADRQKVIERTLRKMGTRLEEVTGKVRNLELENSKLVKEVLKTRNIMEQGVVKMVQKGASLEDIRRRYRLSNEEASGIVTKARDEIAAKLRTMLESGMTRDEIKAAMRDSLKAAPLANGQAPADIDALVELMLEEDFGLPREIAKKGLPQARRKPSKEMTEAEIADEETKAAQAIASRWMEKLATSQSDTLSWGDKAKSNISELEKLIAEHVKNGVTDFESKAVALGATENQARVIGAEGNQERRRVAAIKDTKERERNSPEASAKRIIDRYAKSQIDTQEWGKKKKESIENEILKLVRQHIKKPMDDFIAKAVALGATEAQAMVLDKQAATERARIAQIKELRKKANTNPLTADWSRPTFTDGLASYEFDTKDRGEIISRVEAIRAIAGATGKINTLIGDKKAKAEQLLAEINAILAKYGTDAEGIFQSADPVGTYRFNMGDRAHVAAVARAIQAIDADYIDKTVEWTYGAVLSGLQTMAVNAMAGVHAMWDMTFGRGFEMAVNLAMQDDMSASAGEVKYLLRALKPAISRAWSNARATWSSELPIFNEDVLGMEPDLDRMFDGRAPKIGSIGGKFGRVVRSPMRMLLATDQFNTTAIACIEVGAMAYRIGRSLGKKGAELERFIRQEANTPGSFSYKLAAQKASQRIFTNPLPGQYDPYTKEKVKVENFGDLVGVAASLLTKLTTVQTDGMIVKAMQAILRITLFPFIRTPFNILRAGYRRSINPVSLIDIAILIGRNQIGPDGKWKWNANGRNAEIVERVAQQAQGAALMLFLWGLAEGDDDDMDRGLIITGSMPFTLANRAEREAQMRSGLGPYRISWHGKDGRERVGFNYGRIEPLATAMGSTVDTIKAIKRGMREGKDVSSIVSNMLGSMVSQAKDKSFLRGFSDVIDLGDNVIESIREKSGDGDSIADNRKLRQFLAGRVAMLMPNIIKQPVREADSAFRERTNSFIEELFYQTLPFGQKEAKVDPYGDVQTKTGTAAVRPFDFTDAGTNQVNPFDTMLIRWRDSGKWKDTEGGKPWFPQPIVSSSFRNLATGKEQDMTPQQVTEYRDLAGKRATAILKGMNLNTTAPTVNDIELAKKAFSEARRQVKQMIAVKYSKP